MSSDCWNNYRKLTVCKNHAISTANWIVSCTEYSRRIFGLNTILGQITELEGLEIQSLNLIENIYNFKIAETLDVVHPSYHIVFLLL